MKIFPLAGPVLRVVAALVLAAACFQAGRWTGQLETIAAVANPGGQAGVAARRAAPEPAKPLMTSAYPVGESADIITPLNVRDPAALVMGPAGSSSSSPSGVAPPTPPSLPKLRRRKKPLPEGRLLELLRKKDKTPDLPKAF